MQREAIWLQYALGPEKKLCNNCISVYRGKKLQVSSKTGLTLLIHTVDPQDCPPAQGRPVWRDVKAPPEQAALELKDSLGVVVLQQT